MAILAATFTLGVAQQTFVPFKKTRARGLTESTYGQFPQIMHSGPKAINEHDNQHVPLDTTSNPNSLPVGEIGNHSRTQSLQKFPGINGTGWFPPDCDMGVSNTHSVLVVNVDMAFFNKITGVKTFQTNMTTFFNSLGLEGDLFDPKVFFDKTSGRFFVTVIELNEAAGVSKVLVGVSDDGDPSGIWHKYRIESKMVAGADSWWLDYPGFAANKDAVIITGNMFPLNAGAGYGGCQFIAIPKAPMLTGSPIAVSYLRDPAIGTVQPARTFDGALDRIYLAAAQNGTTFKLYSLTNVLTTPVLASKTVTVPSWSAPVSTARSAGSAGLDSFEGRPFTAMWRANKLVVAHTVRDSGSNVTMCRWYEFNTTAWPNGGNPTLAQSGNLRSTGNEDYHMPAIAINQNNDISVLFTRSSPSIVADLMVASRKVGDPAGAMGQPIKLESSTAGAYQAFRWGDYFAVAVDPADDATFWGFGQVANGNNWLTFWHKWIVTPAGGAVGVLVPPTSVSMFQGQFSTGTLADIVASDDLYYTVRTQVTQQLGAFAALEASFTLAQNASQISTMSVKFEGRGVSGATGFVHLWNWNTNSYDNVKAFPLKSVDTTTNVSLLGLDLSKYVGPGNEVKMVLRGLLPPRPQGSLMPPFDLRTDSLELNIVAN